jgi:Kef-type K+ transport system membrane component KefB
MRRTLLIYSGVLLLCGAGMLVAFERGRHLPRPAAVAGAPATVGVTAPAASGDSASLWSSLRENLKDPISRLLLQVMVIVLATRMLGALFARGGQPAVVGEVLAGILLGPSLLGWLWPQASAFLFPQESLGVLKLFSQIGVCLFMFVVGLELEVSHLRQKAQTAIVVSHASIMIPYLLGVTAALFLYTHYAAPDASFAAFALFMGIALSITAFPVLARILNDRGIAKTFLGSMAITCAAVDDATAWAILAFVVAIGQATSLASTVLCLGLVLAFLGLMFWGVRPRLPRWFGVEAGIWPSPPSNPLAASSPGERGGSEGGEGHKIMAGGEPGRSVVASGLILMIASALTTELIGIHALFGAFLAGVVMPQKREFREYLVVRLEHFSSLFLLPLFFAFSGLRTHVGLLNDATSWLVCLAIIGVATLGKLGGTMFTARLTGMSWNDSFALGALMNTRGLVELVALNTGYDLGILPPRIFAMMVLMALVTTVLTGPLLNLAASAKRRAVPAVATSQ